MAETQTADFSESPEVENKAESTPTPKSKPRSGKGSGKSVTAPASKRGVPVTVWDKPENDPNLRAHVGDDPTGESNTLK